MNDNPTLAAIRARAKALRGVTATPGPWAIETPMDFELAIVEANKPTHEWKFIATVSLSAGDEDEFPWNVTKANATVIAAAPEAVADREALLALVDQLRAGLLKWDAQGELTLGAKVTSGPKSRKS